MPRKPKIKDQIEIWPTVRASTGHDPKGTKNICDSEVIAYRYLRYVRFAISSGSTPVRF